MFFLDNFPSSGNLLINKPVGITSHDVVNYLRKVCQIKKIGHAGTLDPFASGLLFLAIGREATKNLNKVVKSDKVYQVKICLGKISDTGDRTGIIKEYSLLCPNEEEIKKCLISFVGQQEQIPPMYSAKKIKGKKLYQLARQGIEIARQATLIKISKIDFVLYNYPFLTLEVSCSSGTYIRVLAEDIGKKLGTGAYAEELKRLEIGEFSLTNAHDLQEINKDNWQGFLF